MNIHTVLGSNLLQQQKAPGYFILKSLWEIQGIAVSVSMIDDFNLNTPEGSYFSHCHSIVGDQCIFLITFQDLRQQFGTVLLSLIQLQITGTGEPKSNNTKTLFH